MKTRWYNWEATVGQISAQYQAERDWAESKGIRLGFNLYIDFEGNDRFYVAVTDWDGDDVVDHKLFGSFDEAINYLSYVNCEDHVDEKLDKLYKDEHSTRDSDEA